MEIIKKKSTTPCRPHNEIHTVSMMQKVYAAEERYHANITQRNYFCKHTIMFFMRYPNFKPASIRLLQDVPATSSIASPTT